MMHDNSDDELVYHMVMSDSDDDDNQLIKPEMLQLILLYLTIIDGYRSSYKVRDRLEWVPHAAKLIHEDAFHTMYRMPYVAFNKLCGFLHPIIAMDEEMWLLLQSRSPKYCRINDFCRCSRWTLQSIPFWHF
jgi:hypothetical protein